MSHYNHWFNKWRRSNNSSACVVRVTNQCNQSCAHCCFRSGPRNTQQMSIGTCRQVNKWIPNAMVPNLMGGEITILENYAELLLALAKDKSEIRLVTNGYWADDDTATFKFFNVVTQVQKVCDKISIAVSTDEWHSQSGSVALSILENKTEFKVTDEPVTTKNSIAQVGRAYDNNIGPNKNMAMCQEMSSMIVLEDGMIGRCPFGYFPWEHISEVDWHDAQEYVWGWRSERIADGMHCRACMKQDQIQKERLKTSCTTSTSG